MQISDSTSVETLIGATMIPSWVPFHPDWFWSETLISHFEIPAVIYKLNSCLWSSAPAQVSCRGISLLWRERRGFEDWRKWECNLDWQTSPPTYGRLSASPEPLSAAADGRSPPAERPGSRDSWTGERWTEPREEIKMQNVLTGGRFLLTHESWHKAAAIITSCCMYNNCAASFRHNNTGEPGAPWEICSVDTGLRWRVIWLLLDAGHRPHSGDMTEVVFLKYPLWVQVVGRGLWELICGLVLTSGPSKEAQLVHKHTRKLMKREKMEKKKKKLFEVNKDLSVFSCRWSRRLILFPLLLLCGVSAFANFYVSYTTIQLLSKLLFVEPCLLAPN